MARKGKRMNRTENQEEPQLEQEQTPAEEMNQEEAAAENTAEQKAPETEDLQKQLEQARAKTDEYLAMAQRVQADFENYRRRNEAARADSYAEGERSVATAMLAVLDNLERACGAAAESPDEALKSGVELVLKQMQDAYAKLNVTVIDRLGEKFDPNLENAIMQGTEDEGEPGTVCMVLQKGYQMGGHVLRHAMVKVVPD